MQAITTKYYGPAGRLPARVRATSSGGLGLTTPWDHLATAALNHANAALALATKQGWPGRWVGAMLDDEGAYGFISVASEPTFEIRNGRMYLAGKRVP